MDHGRILVDVQRFLAGLFGAAEALGIARYLVTLEVLPAQGRIGIRKTGVDSQRFPQKTFRYQQRRFI